MCMELWVKVKKMACAMSTVWHLTRVTRTHVLCKEPATCKWWRYVGSACVLKGVRQE